MVFKARDPLIGRLVAVKTITTNIADNPDFLERFGQEARAAGGLQHPNIVTIYEMSEFEGTPYIAMEYLEGESLEKKIKERARLPLVHKLGYFVQTCRALDYAHRRGVIHRDVKPGNIMLTSEGVVKVVDFGIARMVDTSKTQTGMMLGTLSYMSPEQIAGKHADQRCDIWALGVVMYELLTYSLPFDGNNHAALLMSIINDEPQRLREISTECPQALEDVVRRAMRKDQEQRYQTMESMLVDLEPIWISMQREALEKIMNHGRELIKNGRLEEASTVLRKSLSLDAGNTAVKALYDQVNEMLGAGQRPPDNSNEMPLNLSPDPMVISEPGKKFGGAAIGWSPIDPVSTQVTDPSPARTAGSNAAAPPSPALRGGRAGETIFAAPPSPAPPQAAREERSKSSTHVPAAPLAKTPPIRRATSQPPAPPQIRLVESQPAQPPVAYAPPKPAPSPRRGKPFYIAAAIIGVLILSVLGYLKRSALEKQSLEQTQSTLPAQPTASSANAAQPESQPDASAATAAAAPASEASAQPEIPVEDQQRRLIGLAHESADSKNFKKAQSLLDDAAKLNGPLNPLIKDLRHEFSDVAHGAELRELAAREQSLWDLAMRATSEGQWDTAEEPLHRILTLPEVNRHWAEAAQYVDEIIPERKKEEQIWSDQQHESDITGPEHRFNEVKLLDQIMAIGGVHREQARRRRDTLMSQFARNDLRKNNAPGSEQAGSQEAKLRPLKDAFDLAMAHKDAKALQQLQTLRPQFKSIVDAGGPQIFDARDYLNNLLPKAQEAIEERLAIEETNAAPNAEYRDAMKQFDQAVATQDAKALRTRVQPEFEKIMNWSGPRAEEARRYVSEFIPAALRKLSR